MPDFFLQFSAKDHRSALRQCSMHLKTLNFKLYKNLMLFVENLLDHLTRKGGGRKGFYTYFECKDPLLKTLIT